MKKVHRPTERVIDILNTISNHKDGISFTDISNATSIPKGTLSPILQTLIDEKVLFLNQSTMKYIIGTKMFKIGYSFMEGIDTIKIIRSHMESIVNECDEICQLGALDGKNVLYMEKVEPVQSIRLESNVGKTLPAYVTALGKCLLTRYNDDEILDMYKDGITKITDKTLDDVHKLTEEVNKVRKDNISYEWGESNDQVMCLAVPIYHGDKPILSISVSVPIYRADKEKIDLISNVLLSKKTEIEKEIKNLEMPDMLL